MAFMQEAHAPMAKATNKRSPLERLLAHVQNSKVLLNSSEPYLSN